MGKPHHIGAYFLHLAQKVLRILLRAGPAGALREFLVEGDALPEERSPVDQYFGAIHGQRAEAHTLGHAVAAATQGHIIKFW